MSTLKQIALSFKSLQGKEKELGAQLKGMYKERDDAQQAMVPVWREVYGLPASAVDTKSTGRVVWVKDAKGVEAAKRALNRLLDVAYGSVFAGVSKETDPVAQAIKVCSKLSWSDWAKVVKAIEATR